MHVHACMSTYSCTDVLLFFFFFTPDETFPLQGTDITWEKTPRSDNRRSIFGRVTGL